MLSSQRVTATTANVSKTVQVCRGTPQGGVLSPLLFTLVMNKLLTGLTQVPGVYAQAYADDVVILAAGADSRNLSERIQEGMDVMNNWCHTTGLTLSARKTTATMFTWKRIWRYHPVRCLGEEISLVENVSYLGVTLNAKLSWIPHIKSRVTKANNCLMISRQTVGTQWGISHKTMRWVYSAMIRPVISYASTVWCAGLEKSTCKRLLSTIQRKACIAISGAFHSTPTASLEMLVGLLPLDIHIRSVALLSMYRLRQNGLWRDAHIKDTAAHRSHVNLCNQHMQSIACLNFLGDLILPVFYPSLPYSYVIEDSADNEDCTALTCFTDGSKKESGETGAGVHFPRGGMSDISRPLGCYPTVFQAEVLAITLAAERLSEYTESRMSVTIYIINIYIYQKDITTNIKIHLCKEY